MLRAFYQTIVIELAEEQHGKGPVHFAGRAGDVAIEVYPLPDDGSQVDSSTRMGFAGKDLAQVLQGIQGIGTKIVTPPRKTSWGLQAGGRAWDSIAQLSLGQNMNAIEQLGRLFEDFQASVAQARQLELPNTNDNMGIKTAIIGFSFSSPRHTWGLHHSNFVKERLEGGYSADSLKEFGAEATSIRLFVGLCLGYLLGLYQAEKLTDVEFTVAEAQIPGLVFLKSGHFLKL